MYGRNRRSSGCVEDDVKGVLAGYGGDPKSWRSTESNDSLDSQSHLLNHHHLPSSISGSSGNLDRDLYNDLVQMVPLVQSLLIDRKSSSSYTRRGSMIYTKTPSRDSKKNDAKNRNAVKSAVSNQLSDKQQVQQSKNTPDESADMAAEKHREELSALKQQLEALQQLMFEKDELLKSAEVAKSQMVSVQSQVEDLKRCAAEKDSLINKSQQQLNDAKIKLADKQAALEKLQWEAKTSNQKVDKLQEELDSMQSQISSLTLLFEGLLNGNPIEPIEDYDITPHYADHLAEMDEMDDTEILNMEEARKAYVEAVAVAKEKQDEESLAAAAKARLHLQAYVFRSIHE